MPALRHPSPRATSIIVIESGTLSSARLPFPLHIGRREEGRVTWEYMCAGWESSEEMHLGVYIVYTLKAIACFNYSLPVFTAWESIGFYGK